MADIKWWTEGVEVEALAREQIANVARLPIVGPHVAIMPDVHWGIGATVGSVIPTRRALIPAAVGVDIGCGMMAVRTPTRANALDLPRLRAAIEDATPIGGPGTVGSWTEPRFTHGPPKRVQQVWTQSLAATWDTITKKHPRLLKRGGGGHAPTHEQLGTLGTGNHFIEICIEPEAADPWVWVLLHSGSRGPGNRIGTYFIDQAKATWLQTNPRPPLGDPNLAWLDAGTALFDDYVEAVGWAQRYAALNRILMMARVLDVVTDVGSTSQDATWRDGGAPITVINCHHNYVETRGPGPDPLYITRKGAVSAKRGELGIIPGSMGAKSYIVRGKGNPDSFESCSHGAGRRMSRGAAKRAITMAEHAQATAGVECRKDAAVLDESPAAYKDIDAVMAAQTDLVEIVHTLKQVVCVKG